MIDASKLKAGDTVYTAFVNSDSKPVVWKLIIDNMDHGSVHAAGIAGAVPLFVYTPDAFDQLFDNPQDAAAFALKAVIGSLNTERAAIEKKLAICEAITVDKVPVHTAPGM